MNRYIDSRELTLALSHQQDLAREAARGRMIREAFRDESKPDPLYARMLRWLGQRLVAWKASVIRRDVMAVDVSPCPSPCPE
jgi:hypothetical protein